MGLLHKWLQCTEVGRAGVRSLFWFSYVGSGAQALGLSSTAFLCACMGIWIWIINLAAWTQTGTNIGWWYCRRCLNSHVTTLASHVYPSLVLASSQEVMTTDHSNREFSLSWLAGVYTPAEKDHLEGSSQNWVRNKKRLDVLTALIMMPFHDCVPQSGHEPTHQASLKPLLYVGNCWARDLAQEGWSLLRKLQHLQGQPQVLNEMKHWEGVHVGGWRRQSRITGTITDICTCFSAWNKKERWEPQWAGTFPWTKKWWRAKAVKRKGKEDQMKSQEDHFCLGRITHNANLAEITFI